MRLLFAGLALSCLASVGCIQQEMSQAEVLKAQPTQDQFVKKDTSIRQPKPETCLEAGKLYESLYKSVKDQPQQQRDLAWRARQAYTQAERLRPQWAAAVAGMARVHELEGNIPAATQCYEVCLQCATGKEASDAAACHEAGLYFTRQGLYDPALMAMQRAIQLEPANRGFAMNYGFALARAGRFDESRQHFSTILSPADAAYQVALMARHVGQIDVSKRFAEQAAQDPHKAAEAQALLTSLNQPVAQTAGAAVQQVQATP